MSTDTKDKPRLSGPLDTREKRSLARSIVLRSIAEGDVLGVRVPAPKGTRWPDHDDGDEGRV